MSPNLITSPPIRGQTPSLFDERTSWADPAVADGGVGRHHRFPAEWLADVTRELRELVDLPEDWDGYGALPVDPRSITRGIEVVGQLARITTEGPDAYGTPDGTAELSWEWVEGANRKELIVEFRLDGRLRYALLDRDDLEAGREAVVHGFDEWLELVPGS